MFGLQVDGDSMWTIYSIGAPSFMHKVFTAVALLGEGGVLMRMGQIGFLVGLFVLVYKIATAAGSLGDLKQSLLAGVIFAAMFGTSTSVKIVGMVPGPAGYANVYVVDHVPWGIAAMGGIISGTGVYLTRRMETAFRDADAIPVTQGGFGRTAEILASVRDMSAESIPNTLPTYSYYRTSMIHYLRDCAVRARHFEVLGDHSIVHAPDPLSAIGFENGMYRTQTWLRTLTGASEQISCPDAHDLLKAKRQDMLASMDPAYQQRFGHDARDALQRAFASLASQDAEAAQKYVSGAMINALWMEAASGSTLGSHGNNTVMMIRSALEQQRVQWATEESIFVRTMRPMIGYFEAFFYALSPFIAFLIGLGAMGLRMIVKYVSLTLAVSLWMPILAITNLYQMTTLQDFFLLQERIAVQSGSGPFSLSNNLALVDQATGAVALASMIAAATPMLTLTLLFGGAVAATSLFSRLQGQDHINEKTAMPDPTSVGAVYQANAAFTGNDALGTRETGQEGNALTFNFSEQLAQTTRSLESKAHRATDQATETFARILARNKAAQETFSRALDHQLSDKAALSENEGFRTLRQNGFTDDQAVSAVEAHQDQSTFNAQAGVSAEASPGGVMKLLNMAGSVASSAFGQGRSPGNPSKAAPKRGAKGGSRGGSGKSRRNPAGGTGSPKLPNIGINASAGWTGIESASETNTDTATFRDTTTRARTNEEAVQLALEQAVVNAMRKTVEDAATLGLSEQDSRLLSQSISDVNESAQAFEEAASNEAKFGSGQSLNALAVAQSMAKRPALLEEVEQLARGLGGDEAFRENLGAISRGDLLGMPVEPTQQRAMASLLTLAEMGPGAAVTQNTPGLQDLGLDRRQALSYALGGLAGLGQEALQSEARAFESLKGASGVSARDNVNSVRPKIDPGSSGELSGTVDSIAKDAEAGVHSGDADRQRLTNSYNEAQQKREAEAIREDAANRTEAIKTTLDRIEKSGSDNVHRTLGTAFENDGFSNPATMLLSAGTQTARDFVINDGQTLDQRLQDFREEAAEQGITGTAAEVYASGRWLQDQPMSRYAPETLKYYESQLQELQASGELSDETRLKLGARLAFFDEPSFADRLRLRSTSAPDADP